MGTIFSSVDGSNASTIHLKTRRNSSISTKLGEALSRKQIQHATEAHPVTLERIILRLERLHPVLKYIKSLFYAQADNTGHLTIKNIPEVFQAISSNMSNEEVYDLFDFIDVTHSRAIGLKEFLVALSVGYVLNLIPGLPEIVRVDQVKLEEVNSFNEKLFSKHEDIKEVIELLVSAFLCFAPQGKWCINKDHIAKLIADKGRQQHLDLMFSEERWNEMGWDEEGNIDFAEFVFSFSSWIELFEDE